MLLYTQVDVWLRTSRTIWVDPLASFPLVMEHLMCKYGRKELLTLALCKALWSRNWKWDITNPLNILLNVHTYTHKCWTENKVSFYIFFLSLRAPGWLSWLSIRLQHRSWSPTQFVSSSPALGSVLTAQSLEPASDSASSSLSALPPLMLCLSLSFKNK